MDEFTEAVFKLRIELGDKIPQFNSNPVADTTVIEQEREIECRDCDDMVTLDGYENNRDGNVYCQDCYDEKYSFNCEDCNDVTDVDERYYYDGDSLCYRCNRDREDSAEEESGNLPERMYSEANLPEFQSKDKGQFIKSERIFSAEIECYYDDYDEMKTACAELPRAFGISYDGSLDNKGVEFQTPKLKGKNGEMAIQTITGILNDRGFSTNRSTGLHIHLDGKDLMPKTRTKTYPKAIAEMLMFYLAMEEVLLSFLPPSRRQNTFCNPLRNNYHISEIEEARSLEALEKIWYRYSMRKQLKRAKSEKYHSSRYAGINLHSLLKDGHLEVRFHSGTLNATKILEWVNLHQTILDIACAKYPMIGTMAKEAVKMPNLEDKTELFFSLLGLSESSRTYFKSRQQTFSSTREDNGESASQNEICAE